MRYKFIISIFALIILTGCYRVNEKTTEIGNLNTVCLDSIAWKTIIGQNSITKINDTIYGKQIDEFKQKPFETDLIYFDHPKEIIAVSKDHYSVRYVYNPEISDQILDGLSSGLEEKEKKRIKNRIQQLLMPYQCEEGRKNSIELMK